MSGAWDLCLFFLTLTSRLCCICSAHPRLAEEARREHLQAAAARPVLPKCRLNMSGLPSGSSWLARHPKWAFFETRPPAYPSKCRLCIPGFAAEGFEASSRGESSAERRAQLPHEVGFRSAEAYALSVKTFGRGFTARASRALCPLCRLAFLACRSDGIFCSCDARRPTQQRASSQPSRPVSLSQLHIRCYNWLCEEAMMASTSLTRQQFEHCFVLWLVLSIHGWSFAQVLFMHDTTACSLRATGSHLLVGRPRAPWQRQALEQMCCHRARPLIQRTPYASLVWARQTFACMAPRQHKVTHIFCDSYESQRDSAF